MSGPGRNVGVTGNRERGTGKMKEKCECKKDAVIIENKKYYCGPCYVNKFVRVRSKRLQSKSLDNCNESTDKGWNRV